MSLVAIVTAVACGLLIPVAALIVIGEAVMRAGERDRAPRARLRGPTRYQAEAEKSMRERERGKA